MDRKHRPRKRTPSLHNLLNEANRRVTSDLRRVVGAKGVPVEFWRVLEVMADERGRSMSELAEESGMQMPATSKLVDRMTDAALLQRSIDLEDHRRVILHISDFGLEKVRALTDDIQRQRDRLEVQFSASREKQLRELLADFIRAQHQASG